MINAAGPKTLKTHLSAPPNGSDGLRNGHKPRATRNTLFPAPIGPWSARLSCPGGGITDYRPFVIQLLCWRGIARGRDCNSLDRHAEVWRFLRVSFRKASQGAGISRGFESQPHIQRCSRHSEVAQSEHLQLKSNLCLDFSSTPRLARSVRVRSAAGIVTRHQPDSHGFRQRRAAGRLAQRSTSLAQPPDIRLRRFAGKRLPTQDLSNRDRVVAGGWRGFRFG